LIIQIKVSILAEKGGSVGKEVLDREDVVNMIEEINGVFRSLEAQDEDSVVFKKIRKSIVDVINNNMNYIDGGRKTGIDV
jgi:chaperonin cofactor prefoldin